MDFPWLTAIILFPMAASLLIPFLPDKDGKTVRWYALVIGAIDFCAIAYTFYAGYDLSSSELQLVERYDWIPQFGLHWSVAADGLSMPLIVLTGFRHHPGNDGGLACHLQASAVLFPDAAYVRRSDRRIRRAGHAALFPGLGTGADPGVS